MIESIIGELKYVAVSLSIVFVAVLIVSLLILIYKSDD